MSKRKVLMTGSTLPRFEGDTEPRFVLDIAKELNKTYDVTILVPMDDKYAKEEEILEGVKVARYHYFPIRKWETLCYPGATIQRVKQKKIRVLLVPFLFLGLRRYLRKHVDEYDMVHAHWLFPQGIIQRHYKKPYLVTGHGGDVTSLNVWPIVGWKKDCIRKAKYVTAVSDYLKDFIRGWGENTPIDVIPMGCDTSRFSPEYREENFFGQGEQKVVLFVGRLTEYKGVSYLLQSMKMVENAKLIIVGTGNQEQELKEQAKEFGDKVEFLGAKTHDELMKIYASADVFAMSSVTASDGGKEGFGLVSLEAMASGIPVVAYSSGGIKEIIVDGENGLLAEEKDVENFAKNLNRALHEDTLREKLIKGGFETAERYSYKNIGSKYSEIYEKVMTNG